MSAWLVSNRHINAIVSYAMDCGLIEESKAATVHDRLKNENMRSLRYRYSNVADWESDAAQYRFERIDLAELYPDAKTIANVIRKACDCYDYQACETDDYRNTEAARFIDRVRRCTWGRGARDGSKAYEAAPWGID